MGTRLNGNKTLLSAKTQKNDEFYTQLDFIEKEINNYKDYFFNKIIYCNCDNCYHSNFIKYFIYHFNDFHIKQLISTCYCNNHTDIFGIDNSPTYNEKPYKLIINRVGKLYNIDDLISDEKNSLTVLNGNGDFRSNECIELLKEADIIVTNPPFSLFNEYVQMLEQYNKKYIIVGNINAVSYKQIFRLIQNNRLWLGYNNNKMMVCETPYKNSNDINAGYIIQKNYNPESGYIAVPSVSWFTNLQTKNRNNGLKLSNKYNENEYTKYDNYDAINVNKVKDIPYDYDGIIGVPITFLDKYNPNQFEIIGSSSTFELTRELGIKNISYSFLNKYKEQGGTRTIAPSIPLLCYYDKNGKACIPYARILIKKRKDFI